MQGHRILQVCDDETNQNPLSPKGDRRFEEFCYLPDESKIYKGIAFNAYLIPETQQFWKYFLI